MIGRAVRPRPGPLTTGRSLPVLGRLTGGVALAPLLLGWAGQIKVGGQLGVPVSPDQPVIPPALFGLAGVAALIAFAGLEALAARRDPGWWRRIALAAAAGLLVGLIVLATAVVVPSWRDTSRVALILYVGLMTIGAAWLTAGSIRPAAPPRRRAALHPVWPPLILGLTLIAGGIAVPAVQSGLPAQSRSLLSDPGRDIQARYLPEVTFSARPIIDNWESQPALYAPPPSEQEIDVRIPPAARLSLTAGLRPSLFLPRGAGVRFQIEWFTTGRSEILYDRTLVQENLNRYGDRVPVEIDLRRLADQEGRLVFRTIPVGIPTGPLVEAAWLNPRILAGASLSPTEALIRDGILSLTIGLLIALWLHVSRP